jgi:hypothetical protein
MGLYINQDADLVTVARGTPDFLILESRANDLALAVLPPVFRTLAESPNRQDSMY